LRVAWAWYILQTSAQLPEAFFAYKPTRELMTKSQLIDIVAQKMQITRGRAKLVINTIFDMMTAALERGDGIEIRGFASFSVRNYKPYAGRDPKRGKVVDVSPKRLPFFRMGKELREMVNGEQPSQDNEDEQQPE